MQTGTNDCVHVIFGGDVMLGRLAGDAIRKHGPDYPLGAITPLLASADLAIVNLECAITDSDRHWPGAPKAFYFGAPPAAALSLSHAGIDAVSLANNHILDFDVRGLTDTLHHLDALGIAHAGAGLDLESARAPALLEAKNIRLGLVAYCDHQPDFAAGASSPGMAFLDLDDEPTALRIIEEDLRQLRRHEIDWPILSLHWGPNMVNHPSGAFRRLAHAAVDMGYRLIFGHSAHVFHGMELYRGCPIIYAAGDLADDYYVDPEFRNDLQLLFELRLARDRVCGIMLHPVVIDDCRVAPATGAAFARIAARAEKLNAEFGTVVERYGENSLRVALL